MAMSAFLAYSHRDEQLKDDMLVHLAMLQRTGSVKVWHDRRIGPGEEWEGVIEGAISQADLVLVLVSPDFLGSSYCYDVELQAALKRHQAGQAVVIPVILRPCQWQDSPLAGIQALPTDGRPVTAWANQDEALFDVAEGIKRVVEGRSPTTAADTDSTVLLTTSVWGNENYSPSGLVALRANSLIKPGRMPSNRLMLIAPDHAYLNDSVLVVAIATDAEGAPARGVSVRFGLVGGRFGLPQEAVTDDMGKTMTKVYPEVHPATVTATARGYGAQSASMLVVPHPLHSSSS